MTITVALLQIDASSTESVPARVSRVLEMTAQAAAKADVVVLPELWNTGAFNIDGAREHAQPIDGDLPVALAAIAKDNGVWLHGGSFCEVADTGEHFNTSVVFAPDGVLVGAYRKIHLFGFSEGETTLMTGGEELLVVDTPLGPTGIATCYDLRFPELFRALTQGEATTFILASGWPDKRIAHWDALLVARAIENQAWVIACNEVGNQDGVILGGHSTVISPTGEVIARAGTAEEVLYVEIDPAEAGRWRNDFPVLKDIRLI